jgi:hypothetical protein
LLIQVANRGKLSTRWNVKYFCGTGRNLNHHYLKEMSFLISCLNIGNERCHVFEQVGRLAWENPALAVTKAAQPMFSVGTHDDLKRAWDWMSQPVRFLGSFKKSKKTKAAKKVVVFGGGSFATAMAVVAARAQPEAQVVMLLRDEAVRDDINYRQMNNRYLPVRYVCTLLVWLESCFLQFPTDFFTNRTRIPFCCQVCVGFIYTIWHMEQIVYLIVQYNHEPHTTCLRDNP